MPSSDYTIELTFQKMSEQEFDDLKNEVAATIQDVREGLYDKELKTLDVPLEVAKSLLPDDIRVQKGQQLTPLEAALILVVVREGAKIGSRVILDIWSIAFDRLKRRFGQRVRLPGRM